MSTAAPVDEGRPHRQVAPSWTAGLLDDAALFPPGDAPMAGALPAHGEHVAAWYGGMVGPFLCPVSRLAELRAALAGPTPLRVGLIADTGLGGALAAADEVRADARLALAGVELALPDAGTTGLPDAARRAVVGLRSLADGTDELALAVELPRLPEDGDVPAAWSTALDVLAEDGLLRAKLRTGGLAADSVPSAAALAAFLRATAERELAAKLTAGLHHAVRRRVPAGHDGARVAEQVQHGLLNVLVAAAAAVDGASATDLARLLDERDPTAVAAAAAPDRLDRARRLLTSVGTCSITEPVGELVSLGLLAGPRG